MKRCISAALVLLMLAGAFALPAAAVGDLSVTLVPSESEHLAVGDTFTIAVELDAACTVKGVDVRLVYEPTVLEIEASEAEWTYPPASDGSRIMAAVGDQGDARYGALIWGAQSPVSAEAGAFVTIPFKVLAVPEGHTTQISLQVRQVKDASDTLYNITSTPATVTIDHVHETDEAHTTAAVPATCTDSGNIAYFQCTYCEKLFSDAGLTRPVTLEDTVLTARGHSMQHFEATSPTSTQDGNIEYWYCSRCEKYFTTADGNNAEGDGTSEITQEETVIPAGTVERRPGDVNVDGKVNGKDVTVLMRYLSGETVEILETKNIRCNLSNADVNADNKVNGKDITLMMRVISGDTSVTLR